MCAILGFFPQYNKLARITLDSKLTRRSLQLQAANPRDGLDDWRRPWLH